MSTNQNGNGKHTKTPKAQEPEVNSSTQDHTFLRTLEFEDLSLEVRDTDGQLWLTADQLGTALGYSNSRDSVNRLFLRNRDEFTEDMSVTVKLTATDGKEYDTRVFSPRGCYALAFFAKTDRAKAFRRWVLDVLEREQLRTSLPAPRERLLPGLPPPDSFLPGFPPLTREQLASLPKSRTYAEVRDAAVRFLLFWWQTSPARARLKQAHRYFSLGLNADEVRKLLECSQEEVKALQSELQDMREKGILFVLEANITL